MRILVDMNLSPAWVGILQNAGHEAVHWSSVGERTAPDREILAWARERGYVLFTHDLDFGAILAATAADAPSVIQIRTQDVSPQQAAALLLDVLQRFAYALGQGALISVEEHRARIRVLPLGKTEP
jgi:predicted nuclease of predicted toxin-antitoxin system